MVTEINSNIKDTKQYNVVNKTTLIAGTPGDQYIRVDPRKITIIEIHADGQSYTLQTATIANDTNDLEDGSQLWITKQAATTADFQSGETTNRGFLGIKIIVGTLTSDFTYQVAQVTQNDKESLR